MLADKDLKVLRNDIKDIILKNIDSEITLKDFDENKRLVELGINSISLIKIVVNLEEKFDFVFDEDNLTLEKFPNLLSLVEYIKQKLS